MDALSPPPPDAAPWQLHPLPRPAAITPYITTQTIRAPNGPLSDQHNHIELLLRHRKALLLRYRPADQHPVLLTMVPATHNSRPRLTHSYSNNHDEILFSKTLLTAEALMKNMGRHQNLCRTRRVGVLGQVNHQANLPIRYPQATRLRDHVCPGAEEQLIFSLWHYGRTQQRLQAAASVLNIESSLGTSTAILQSCRNCYVWACVPEGYWLISKPGPGMHVAWRRGQWLREMNRQSSTSIVGRVLRRNWIEISAT
jgi:hypothetical protein